MKKITTKKQFYNAKFLGTSLKHGHNWKRMYVVTGKGKSQKKKLVTDSTGGFLQCSICGECAFVDNKQLDKYRDLLKKGIPTANIVLSLPNP